jgi:TPP-dependent pyruvate/acetoin dehydrogenase alpha subunit
MRDAGYRTSEEVDSWKLRDPIKLLKTLLLDRGLAAPGEIEDLDAQVLKLAEDAAQWARQSPLPDPSTATLHVFAQP